MLQNMRVLVLDELDALLPVSVTSDAMKLGRADWGGVGWEEWVGRVGGKVVMGRVGWGGMGWDGVAVGVGWGWL